MNLTPEFEADIRARVNPAYVDVLGTESCERAALLGEIDRLRTLIADWEGITAFGSALQELDERGKRIDELSAVLEYSQDYSMRLRAAIQKTLDDNGHLADGDNCTLIVLKRALGIQSCRKCGADMQPGVAMGQTLTGIPDFIGDDEVCTVSPGGPGKLIECSKCPGCGWSVTA